MATAIWAKSASVGMLSTGGELSVRMGFQISLGDGDDFGFGDQPAS
ncbi:hypothetical protein ACVJ6Q_009079, partial [Bradyrhizobium elkanii]